MLTSRSQRGAATPEYSILVTDRASGKGRVVKKFLFLVGAHFTNLLFVPLWHHEAPRQQIFCLDEPNDIEATILIIVANTYLRVHEFM